MKQSLQLRLGQHLTMTPQLQQAIRLLQLSTLELKAEIQEALESNPMLELAEDSENETQREQVGTETSTASEGSDASDAAAEFSKEEIPQDLPVDSSWEDTFDYTATSPSNNA